ncbi:MAG: hypothetical protein V3U76_16285 [Granulosicoccus sp.]
MNTGQFTALLLILFTCLSGPAQAAQWQRVNIGGGGAMNIVGAGPTGTLVAGTDLAGAYIKKTSDSQWQMITPDNGVPDTHITGVAFDPSNANIILLATEGGLYRSGNAGTSFTAVDQAPASSIPYAGKYLSIAYQPSTAGNGTAATVYASRISNHNVADSKILRSDDGGNSFVYTADLIPAGAANADNIAITKIVIHPNNPDVVLALANQERQFIEAGITTLNALFMSDDRGNTWTQIALNIPEISDVAFNPVAPYHAFVASVSAPHEARVHYAVSDIASDNWQLAFTTPGYDDQYYQPVLILWPDASTPQSMRVINIDTTYHFQTEAGWRISNNSGNANGWQFSGLGESRDWAGTQNNWKLGWSRVFTILSPTLESANHTIGFDLSNPDRLLWATNQFVFGAQQVTQNNGDKTLSFENLATTGNTTAGWSSTGLDNITPFILEVNARDSDVIYAGLNDLGCTVSDDKGDSWKLCTHNTDEWEGGINADISYGGVTSALISDPKDAKTVWMFAAGDQRSPVSPLRSTDSGTNWTSFDNNWQTSQNPSTPDVYGLSLDPTSDPFARRLYVTAAGAVYKSEDSGEHWAEVYDCNAGCRVTEVAGNGTVYAGGEAGLFVSFNHGTSWSPVMHAGYIGGNFNAVIDDENQQVFNRHVWSGISGIAIDPNVPEIVYVAVFNTNNSQGVYKCDISGSINVNTDCTPTALDSAFVRDVAVDPNNAQNLFATSSSAYTSGGYIQGSTGVWRSVDGGTSWQTLNDGLDWPMAFAIVVDPNDGNIVYTGSPGGGNYRINLDEEQTPAAATLQSPSGNISNSTPTYSWNAVANASWYYIWVKDSGGIKFRRWYTASQASCGSGAGECSVTAVAPLDNGSGQWWIKTWNSAGHGPWSSPLPFDVDAPADPPPATTLQAPSGSINDSTPSYRWHAQAESSWYYLWVNDSSGNRIKRWYTAAQAGCGDGSGLCEVTPPNELADGNGRWWVLTWNSHGHGPWSSRLNFSVE